MNDRAVSFKNVAVHRALGIHQSDGFEIQEISRGINLIYGPNGSGKTTTALVIQELLWPGKTNLERPTVDGTFEHGETIWSIRIDAGHVETENALHTGTTPDIGPSENRSRYMLALHELINDKNTNFARIITAESQGGFDLDAAKNNLGFTSPARKPANAVRAGNEARRHISEARTAQRLISTRELLLPGLGEEHQRAVEAQHKVSVMQIALELKSAESLCRQISNQITTFPEGIALLSGNERTLLNKLAEDRHYLETKTSKSLKDKNYADRTIKELKLPEQQMDKSIRPAIRGLCNELRKNERAVDDHKRQLLSAESEAETALKRIGSHISPQQLSALKTVKNDDLSSLARQSDEIRAKNTVLQERRRKLSGDENEVVNELRIEQIREGVSSLRHWLETPDPTKTSRTSSQTPLISASVLIAVLAVTLAFTYNPVWILLILPAIGLFLFGKPEQINAGSPDPRAVYVSNYKNTGLPTPVSWETVSVMTLLRSLINLAEIRIQEDRRFQELNHLKTDEVALEHHKSELDKQRQLVEKELGFSVSLDNQWLPLLVQNISRWQKNSSASAAAKSLLSGLESERQTLLKAIMLKMSPFGYNEILSAEQAALFAEDLAEKLTEYNSAVQKRETAEINIADSHTALQRIQEERLEVFSKLRLDPSQDNVIDKWLEQRPNYLKLLDDLADKEAVRKNRLESLSDNEELLDLNPSDIKEKLRKLLEESSRRDDLLTEIRDIKAEIKTALAGHQLSDALSEEDAARAVLADLREQNNKAIAGEMLINWVREVAIDRSRPQVFKRACELVAEFTRGHLKLVIDDKANPPEFLTSVGGRTARPVDKLSIGERVQVLIAIRTAFLDQNEPVRLPLLLDEALGTSDDLRAGLIIDAVIKIAEGGRQVFYFTAQNDEIAKWTARLKNSDTPYKMIDLGKIRRMEAVAALPLEITPPASVSALSPGGMTHKEYGAALNVPNINPWAENLDGLHLWHLVTDDNLLYQFLNYQINKWGQLKNLIGYGGKKLFPALPEQFDELFASAAAIETACGAWRIGRGKKVDRQTLQDSKCVSKSFIDLVTELSDNLNGNAAGIIAGLKNKEIRRWSSAKTEDLQNYFEDNGYLSTEAILTPQDIRIRVLASVTAAMNKDLIDQALVDRIVGSLPA